MRIIVTVLFVLVYSMFLPAQTIVPVQTDEIIIDNGTSGKADPNDRIRYKVTIQNTATPGGTGVQLNVVPDPRTAFVSGSFRSSPLAVADAYACTGNVGLNVPAANGLKSNDFDDALAGANITAGTFATTQSGSIMIVADGSFMYSPPAGFTGTDTYTYTLTDGNPAGLPVPLTDMATVTFTISNLIWFVNNTGGGTGGTGTLSNPFKTLADFNAGSTTAGDVVYIEETGANYPGNITLQNNERLFGKGHSGGANLSNVLPFTPATFSKTLPNINGTPPTIAAAATGITLANGNAVRGIAVSGGANSVLGTNTAGLSFQENSLSGASGDGLNLSNPSGTVGILDNVMSAALNAVDIATTSGALSLDLSENVLLSTGNVAATINGSGGGALTITGFSNNTVDANTANTAIVVNTARFDATAGGAFNTVSGGTTLIGVAGNGVAGGGLVMTAVTGDLSFTTLNIYAGNNSGLGIASSGAFNVGSATGFRITVSAGLVEAAAAAVTLSNVTADVQLSAITSMSSGSSGLEMNTVAGTFSAAAGSITGTAVRGVYINGGSLNFSYGGTINNSLGFAVDIDNHDSGNATFSGNITSTGGTGIRVQNCAGGTKAFSGSSKSLTTATNAAVTLSSNTGATVNFTGGGLIVNVTSGTGFNATGGGTLNITGTGNTITTGTGTGLNVAGTTIGASGLNFRSIAANGALSGIILNNTGASGGLTVTGTGSAGTGGTIQNCTGAGISLTSTANTNLSYMNIQGGGDDGINGSSVTGLTLSSCTVTNNGNSTADEGIDLNNLFGTSNISNCTVTNNAHNNFELNNSSGTLTALSVSGSTFEGHNSSGSFGNHGFLFDVTASALVTAVNITNCIFRNNKVIGMQVLTGDDATISSYIVSGCTFSDTGTGNSQEIAADFSTAQTSDMTYQFLNNILTGHNSQAFNTFTAAGAGTGGTLTATIQGNTIGNQAVIDSGSKNGNGLRINVNGGASARIKVDNNTIHQIPVARGIEAIARNGTGGASFIITNNTVTAPTGTLGTGCGAGVLCPLAPIFVQTNDVTIGNSACSVVSGNTAYNPASVPGGAGSESSVLLQESNTSTLTYEGNTMLTALQNLTNANPGCVTKSVVGTVAVVAANTCPTL